MVLCLSFRRGSWTPTAYRYLRCSHVNIFIQNTLMSRALGLVRARAKESCMQLQYLFQFWTIYAESRKIPETNNFTILTLYHELLLSIASRLNKNVVYKIPFRCACAWLSAREQRHHAYNKMVVCKIPLLARALG